MKPATSFRSITSILLLLITVTLLASSCCEGFTSIQRPVGISKTYQQQQQQQQQQGSGSGSGRKLTAVFARTYCTPPTASTVIEEETTTTTKPSEKTTIEILKDDDLEEQKDNNRDGWEIRLWNDPFNKREFVARCLTTICNKSDTESYQIMMQAHKNGMGVIGRYHFEIAEQYHGSLKENGLTVDMIQVDDE
mmetsp:Transcript_44917/g.109036  ORF Transcript_44917/g.109036 Transcript_44917/m.109036 type:complete len:193 (-) Transcript_44917:519-1097(-)